MKAIVFSDLDSLYKWMVFIVNTREATLEESNYQLNIFGDDDDAYLIINRYETENSATEYYFKPNDGVNNLLVLLSLLEKFDFSLEKLIKDLSSWNFIESDIGYHVVFGDMCVFKENVKSN